MTVESIGWALLHTLWQGGLVAAALGGALLLARRASAAVRYNIAATAMALLVLLPAATVLATTVWPSAKEATSVTAMRDVEPVRDARVQRDEAVGPAVTAPAAPGESATPARYVARATPEAVRAVVHSLRPRLDVALPWLVGGWAVGLLVLSARLVGGIAQARRLAREGTRPADPGVRAATERLAARLRVRVAVRVAESRLVRAPIVAGVVRPVILLPENALDGLTRAQLEMLLAHELAHVRRHDVLVNLGQTLVETLFYFHPAVWWVSGRMREERENCCDDLALRACGGDALDYSAALLSLAEARDAGAALAAASTAGPLLRRVARLVTRAPAHLDLGPRWIAGVLTIVVGLVSASDAVGITPRPGLLSRSAVVGGRGTQPPARSRAPNTPDAADSARWRPGVLVDVRERGPLPQRWRAADDAARARHLGAYWIGWTVPDVVRADGFYMDRETAVRDASGTSAFTGRMSFDGGDLRGLRFDGVALAPLLGAHAAGTVTVFLRVEGAGRRLTNVHVAPFDLPMHFDRLPLVWLDGVGAEESVAQLRRMAGAERDAENRGDLVAAIGMHVGAASAVDALLGWLDDRAERVEIRREAAEWLGRQPDRRALLALARTARAGDDPSVRRESVEALEDVPRAEAADTLVALARELDDRRLRHEAIEALGNRTEPPAIAYLESLVRERVDVDLARRAVEALANLPGGRGADLVVDVARRHADPIVRKEAVEAVAELQSTARALELLREVAYSDPDPSVRVEAVESMADVRDPRSVALLARIVAEHRDERVQVAAAEALASTADPAAALDALARIARAHPLPAVQRKAAESIGDFDDLRAVELLLSLAETHSDRGVQMEATEALGNVHPRELALAGLRKLARDHPRPDVRRKAAETIADYEEGSRP